MTPILASESILESNRYAVGANTLTPDARTSITTAWERQQSSTTPEAEKPKTKGGFPQGLSLFGVPVIRESVKAPK